jgi:ribonuclease VapC
MIVVDTSAFMSILNEEEAALDCRQAVRRETSIVMSAGTYTEAMVVASRRGLKESMAALLHRSISEVIPLTPTRAQLAADAYSLWGKSFHRASLNFGDCFAYAAAKEFDCPLLFIGNDFSQTDIRSAIPR